MCLGSVPFLYAEPLLRGLRERADVSLVRDVPEVIARDFVAGSYEAALLPVLDAIRRSRARIVPGLGACAVGAVRSERLLCRVTPAEVRTLAVAGDRGAVARILLAEMFSVRPRLVEDADEADAVVLAGDAGLAAAPGRPYEHDLGELWTQLTGLPLVLAVWCAGEAAPPAKLRALLTRSLHAGLECLEEIAADAPSAHGVDTDIAYDYLSGRIRYRMGGIESESLRKLLELGAKHGFCQAGVSATFC